MGGRGGAPTAAAANLSVLFYFLLSLSRFFRLLAVSLSNHVHPHLRPPLCIFKGTGSRGS